MSSFLSSSFFTSLPPLPFQYWGQPSPIICLQTISFFKFSHFHYIDRCLLGSSCFNFHCIFFSPSDALLRLCSHPLPPALPGSKTEISCKKGKKNKSLLLSWQTSSCSHWNMVQVFFTNAMSCSLSLHIYICLHRWQTVHQLLFGLYALVVSVNACVDTLKLVDVWTLWGTSVILIWWIMKWSFLTVEPYSKHHLDFRSYH